MGIGPGVTGGVRVGGKVDPRGGVGPVVGAPLGCGVGTAVLHTGTLQQGSFGSCARIQ